LEAKASELVEKGVAKTKAQAFEKAAQQNPALYKEYLEEGTN
jgi:hypothetical protein